MKTYTPGTIHRVADDPDDPHQVNVNLQYNWVLFGGPISFAAFAVMFIGLGVYLYRSPWTR